MQYSVSQIPPIGRVGTKHSIVVMGDGFTADAQGVFDLYFKIFFLDGLMGPGHGFFHDYASAFVFYKINLVSKESGVTHGHYDDSGNLIIDTPKQSALEIIHTASWEHCWIEWGTHSLNLIQALLNALPPIPDPRLVVILLNEAEYGGCTKNGYVVFTIGAGWYTLEHELGHDLGGLGDEYCKPGTYTGGEPPYPNLTINTNPDTLKWKNLLAVPRPPIPTGVGDCAGYNQGPRPPTWSDSQSVGLFEGGYYNSRGVYRPAINDCMNVTPPPSDPPPQFCPVCYSSLASRYKPFMAPEPAGQATPQEPHQEIPDQQAQKIGAQNPIQAERYVRLRLHVENGQISVVGAREFAESLVMPDTLQSGFVYEVTVDTKRIAVDLIPDLGVTRGFPNPQGTPGQEGHSIIEESSYDFNVRIPYDLLSLSVLPSIQITLYRVKADALGRPIGSEPLRISFAKDLQEVAQLKGIHMEHLPGTVQEDLRRILHQ